MRFVRDKRRGPLFKRFLARVAELVVKYGEEEWGDAPQAVVRVLIGGDVAYVKKFYASPEGVIETYEDAVHFDHDFVEGDWEKLVERGVVDMVRTVEEREPSDAVVEIEVWSREGVDEVVRRALERVKEMYPHIRMRGRKTLIP